MNFLTSRPGLSSSGGGRATIVGGDNATLREFLAQTTGAFGMMGETTVYIGQLPPSELGIPIPLPQDAQITGSIVRGTNSVEVLTIAHASTEQAHASYEKLLLASGWQQVEDFPMGPRGFVDSPMIVRRYCNKNARASLLVNASAADNDSTALRLNLSHDPHPCVSHGMMHRDIYKYLPNLQTPPGVRLIPGGYSGSGGGNPGSRHVNSAASLATERSVAEIAQAYDDQLSALGWRQVASETGERFACSTWITTQEDTRWSAFLTLATNPVTPNEYNVWLSVHEHAE